MADNIFQMEERDSPIVDDPVSWGTLAEFVVEHPSKIGCGRPNYVRATIGYAPSLIQWVGRDDSWKGRLATLLYKLLPILFGGKVLLCSSCHSMVFAHTSHEKIWTFIQSLRMDECGKMLIYHGDIEHIPEDKVVEMKAAP
jgi:hypothetical protein